jgi:hypothetical protein
MYLPKGHESGAALKTDGDGRTRVMDVRVEGGIGVVESRHWRTTRGLNADSCQRAFGFARSGT